MTRFFKRHAPLPMICCALVFAMSARAAQSSEPAEVQALPAWPVDGKIPTNEAGHFVFRDSRTGEIVVSYAEPADPSRHTTFRFWLENRVDPQVRIELGRNSERLYTYEYCIANGPAAKSPIVMWNVVGPTTDVQLKMSHPVWKDINGAATPVAPQALLRNVSRGAFLLWDGVSKSIPPGSQATGFRIVSSFRPGLTTGYAIGQGGIVSPGEVPENVVQQLIPLEAPPVMWKPFLAIGPRFDPGVSQSEIVRTYQIEISDLTKRGLLDSRSPYLIELQTALSKSAAEGRLEGFPIAATTRSFFENSLAKALHLCLFSGDDPR